MLDLNVETLEGVDESLHSLYEKGDDGFTLKVNGIPEPEDVTGLKSALQKEREGRKDAEKKAKQLADEKEGITEKSLLEKEQYKELYESEKEKRVAQETKNQDIVKGSLVDRIISTLTKDPKKGIVLKNQLNNLIDVTEGDPKVINVPGVETLDGLQEHIKEQFYFLVDGNKSSGGGATGGSGGTTKDEITQEAFDAKTPVEKMNFVKKGGKIKV